MLILTRKKGERILIGKNVAVTVCKINGDRVKIGIEADDDTLVLREEVAKRNIAENPPDETLGVAKYDDPK